jgi:uncharacterized protein with von Willebrand factor type A (vWA) domain
LQERQLQEQQKLEELQTLSREKFGVFNTLWGRYHKMLEDDPRRGQLETSMLAAEDDWLKLESRLDDVKENIDTLALKSRFPQSQIQYYRRMLSRTSPSQTPEEDKLQEQLQSEKMEELRKLEAEEARRKGIESLMRGTFPAASRSNDSRRKAYRWVRREEY